MIRPGASLVTAKGRIAAIHPVWAVAVTLAVVLGGAGVAGAATGGTFILGRGNTETRTAGISDSRGTPLSLSAPKNKAPLAVNRNVMVRNLNAQYVGGLSASAVKPTGGDGINSTATALPEGAFTQVASTGSLAAGTYYVTATADVQLEAGNSSILCVLTVNSDTDQPLQDGGESGGPFVQAAETVAVKVHNKDTLREFCSVTGSNNASTLRTAGITAIRVLSSSGSSVPGT
jgi:hypothetical protein